MKRPKEMSYEDLFFQRLLKNEDLKKEKEILGSFFKRPIWWFIKSIKKTPPKFTDTALAKCEICKRSARGKGRCLNSVLKAVSKAKRTKRVQLFVCPNNLSGFCMPIIQDGKLYGYIGLCHSDVKIPFRPLELFANFINTMAKDIQKGLELAKLYATIKPRAIALSTVHTIHRLISSTLDLDELLPRIARLVMQVMQAHRCSIKLLDKERNMLKPITTIDLRAKRKLHPKELRVGKGVPGRAVKQGKVLKGRGFLSVPLIDEEEVIGVITVYDKIDNKPFTQFDQEIMMTIAEQAVIAVKNAQLYKEQENLAIDSIRSLATILDAQGPGAFLPRTSFTKIVIEVGKEMGIGQVGLRSLECAVILHNAGQMFVPGEILSKPSRLTGEEYRIIKEQPAKGAMMLEPIRHLKPVIPIILHHHENYDGTGYPSKLKGNQIPQGARILAVVSAFLAMITPRAYRVTKTIEEAKQEIGRNSGTQFDPKVVAAFLKVMEKKDIMDSIEEEYDYESAYTPKGSDIF